MRPPKILLDVCSIPTAPFAEQHVVRYVERFVGARKNLTLSRDTHGNLLIVLPGRSKKRRPRWIFAAHMDHPGFVATKMLDDRTLQAAFHGWVHIDYVRGAKVRFFEDNGREIVGTVIDATPSTHDRLTVPDRVTVRVSGPVTPGSPGMFDQSAARMKGNKLYSRGIDDQGGVASALAMLDILHKKSPALPVGVLLTRAEEEGFVGAVAAVLKPKLLRKSDRIIAIECSAMQPYAPQGQGVIIRVGDKTSIFNSALTYFLTQQAAALAKADKSFSYQRALMPGGTCEATVYDAFGYTAAAACIALGNYHNMDRKKKKIGPEFIDVNDWKNMVKLFVHVARGAGEFEPDNAAIRKRVRARFNKLKHLL
ncbi:MAG: M20/M25/M40 family metallo-hydrolase [Tepidisphaeraceae bacterium]